MSSSLSAASAGASVDAAPAGQRVSTQEIVAHLERLRNEQQSVAAKIAEIESERNEYRCAGSLDALWLWSLSTRLTRSCWLCVCFSTASVASFLLLPLAVPLCSLAVVLVDSTHPPFLCVRDWPFLLLLLLRFFSFP